MRWSDGHICAYQIILLIDMNFVNFLASPDSVIGFKLNRQSEPQLAPQEVCLTSNSPDKGNPFGPCSYSPGNHPEESSLSHIMEERQRLINQYLQLNIRILQKQVREEAEEPQLQQIRPQLDSPKKKIRKINSCGHDERPHYAKGLCNNCYHRYGRVKRPWRCPHDKLYAGGMCQNCYINDYNRKRREQARIEDSKDALISSTVQVSPAECVSSSAVSPEKGLSDVQ